MKRPLHGTVTIGNRNGYHIRTIHHSSLRKKSDQLAMRHKSQKNINIIYFKTHIHMSLTNSAQYIIEGATGLHALVSKQTK